MKIVPRTFVNESKLWQKSSVELSRYFHVFHPQIDVIKATRFHFVNLTLITSQFNRTRDRAQSSSAARLKLCWAAREDYRAEVPDQALVVVAWRSSSSISNGKICCCIFFVWKRRRRRSGRRKGSEGARATALPCPCKRLAVATLWLVVLVVGKTFLHERVGLLKPGVGEFFCEFTTGIEGHNN